MFFVLFFRGVVLGLRFGLWDVGVKHLPKFIVFESILHGACDIVDLALRELS